MKACARSSSNISRRARRFISKARCRRASGPDKDGNDKYSTEVVLQGFNSSLTMLDSRGGGGASGGGGGGGEDYSGGGNDDFGSSGPTASRKPAMAAAGGKRGDMDDEIPLLRFVASGPKAARKAPP